MKKGFVVKLVLSVLLVVALVFIGYKMIGALTELIVGAISGAELHNDGYESELVTPEPMPTMPAYMGDDSFYDNAGSVDFGDE